MINWTFITAQEGYSLTGYWPEGQMASGVTVAGGVDLGHLERTEFLALPDELQNKVLPYLGVTGSRAKLLLNGTPLVLTQDEADLLEKPKRAQMESALRDHYSRGAFIDFNLIPDAVQTVLMSVTWQYGTPWKRCPLFWSAACRAKWAEMIGELRNFGDAFQSRRKREADYLESHINLKGDAA